MPFFDFFRRQEKPTVDGADRTRETTDNGPRHCFVLCRAAEPNDLSNASRVVSRVFGPGYTAEVGDANIVTVTHGGDTAGFLAHMPAPIPNGEAEENADRNVLWPHGREEAGQHRSHVIVTNIGAGDLAPVQSAIDLSRLALAALELFDGLGVYWGHASVCNSRALFEDFCGDMDNLPVPLWLRFQPVRTPAGELGLYTLGMDQFGLMDIEVDRCGLDAEALFELVSNLAHYLIQNGPVIADGNTFGGSEDERILVRHRPSMIDKRRRVYKIVLGE